MASPPTRLCVRELAEVDGVVGQDRLDVVDVVAPEEGFAVVGHGPSLAIARWSYPRVASAPMTKLFVYHNPG